MQKYDAIVVGAGNGGLSTACTLAKAGKKVLLIDSDLRRPSIHSKTGIPNQPGLAELLTDSNAVSSSVHKYQSSKTPTSFDILPSGTLPSNPSELLTSKRMETLLKTLKTVYDFILLDLPPVGAVIDAVSISTKTDGMIVVIRENNCPAGVFRDCIAQIQEANVPILGFVMNGALEGSGKKSGYSKYGKGYYGGGYGSYYGNYGSYYGPNNAR